ncbi:MAG: gliding motility-associated ABC transporter permease subunit GldF [Bacteroidetes bacterium]|nr:MAG: gliding motility-associated ABC transporter permease subunit GldF [Bacteroidota bacterium]
MWPIYTKELTGFFATLTGYVAGATFLALTGLLIFVIPGQWNALDTAQANLNTLFNAAPWLFLFLVPAVTMRMFAEERKEGTLELLLSRPVSPLQVLMGKFLAALTLIALMILPTLVYYITVHRFAAPPGNVDSGAAMGSYLGLLLLAAVYTAIGLFASSLTRNPIVAFMLAALLALLAYIGFESVAGLPLFLGHQHQVATLGIEEHYRAIRRGVVDSRDIIYFLSLVALFLYAAILTLKRGK